MKGLSHSRIATKLTHVHITILTKCLNLEGVGTHTRTYDARMYVRTYARLNMNPQIVIFFRDKEACAFIRRLVYELSSVVTKRFHS